MLNRHRHRMYTKFDSEGSPTSRTTDEESCLIFKIIFNFRRSKHHSIEVLNVASHEVTKTFIDNFGLELVGHVDESPMEDV